ncbi:MAG TPA: carboxymuconolactone decarboxylase family protein [Aquihabitans sp.]|jgi:alkylhydroperoxidase family enzyme|nr:carboxymuconolactone decarboxylase family protein [Aquihabitans sp.]
MDHPPRIAPLPAEGRDPRTEELLRSLRRDPDGEDMHLFSTLAHHPRLLKRWSAFGGLLLAGGALPPRDREVLILRTAANTGADYEWGHHLPIGRAAGLSDDEVASLASFTSTTRSPHDDLLVRAADELHADAVIGDDTWAELAATYDEQQLIEVCMVVGQYHLVGFTLNSLRIQREAGVEALPS